MDVAIVTGAATGLGLAIARKLNDIGFRVYGLGGNYEETPYKHGDFIGKACNLADAKAVQDAIREIIKIEGNIFAIVNNAKIYTHKHFDETDVNDLESIMRVNLLCPIVMVREALSSLCKFGGYFINIGPNKPEFTRGGPAGAAAAGGLYYLSESLFENYRDSGLKVTNIFPQINAHRPDRGPAPQAENPQSVIDVEAVAKTVAEIINSRSGNLVSEMVIRPQRVVEDPVPPTYRVPYPKPKPLPRTTPREVIEQQDLEDMLADELPREPKKMSARKLRKPFEANQGQRPQRQGRGNSTRQQNPRQKNHDNASGSDDRRQDRDSRQTQKDRRQNWNPRRKQADGNRDNENREHQEKPISDQNKPSQDRRENKEFSKERPHGGHRRKPFLRKDAPKDETQPQLGEKPTQTAVKTESPKAERSQVEAKAKESPKSEMSAKKVTLKKSVARKKTATKKTVVTKDAAEKKVVLKKAPAKKAATKKTTVKKAAAKKTVAKKSTTKKVAKKAAAKKRTAKKAVTKKVAKAENAD